MKKVWIIALALAALTVTASEVHAFGHRCADCCPLEPICVTYVDKAVTCYKTQMVEKEIKCTVSKVYCKVVETEHKCTVMVPVWTDEKRECTVYKSVPKVIEKDVTCVRMVPVVCKDPCTGCTCSCCKPETYTQKVKCTVCELVPEKKEYTVKLCSFKPEERAYKTQRTVYECRPETVTRKVLECVQVPYQTTVKVAVCTPCAK